MPRSVLFVARADLEARRVISRFLLILFLVFIGATAQAFGPPPTYFSWISTGADMYEADVAGYHGTLVFTKPGNDTLTPKQLTATAPSYVAQYGATIHTAGMSNGVSGSAANCLAEFTFNPPLPVGSRLIALDLDISLYDERFEFTHSGGVFNFLNQLESHAGEASVFPTWSAATGVLQSQDPRNDNEYEATVFDISGINALSARLLRNGPGGGISNAHVAIAIPVPEPASMILAIALIALIKRGVG